MIEWPRHRNQVGSTCAKRQLPGRIIKRQLHGMYFGQQTSLHGSSFQLRTWGTLLNCSNYSMMGSSRSRSMCAVRLAILSIHYIQLHTHIHISTTRKKNPSGFRQETIGVFGCAAGNHVLIPWGLDHTSPLWTTMHGQFTIPSVHSTNHPDKARNVNTLPRPPPMVTIPNISKSIFTTIIGIIMYKYVYTSWL